MPRVCAALYAIAGAAFFSLAQVGGAAGGGGGSAPAPSSKQRGHRIAISADGLTLDLNQVNVLSSHVYDYTFTTAPTDWIPRSGIWQQTNRWDCSPEWTWYGGYDAQGVAATWNKRQFVGDITVEIYAAMKMGVGGERRYKNPNDMNITVHGDGVNLDSGYSFIMGGGLNTFSRIMKGNLVLAETRDEAALFPIFEDAYPTDAYDFHRKWWALRARLCGNKLQFYKDERLILEAQDPDPLPGGRVALWTMHNGIVVSRAKIYYQAEKVPPDPIPFEALLRKPETHELAPRLITVSSDTHPAIYNDFEVDIGDWRGFGAKGTRLTLVSPGADGKGHALALINESSGGQFGARLRIPRLDARKYGRLTFDYKVDPDVRLNLYCVVNSGIYEIVFTAPDGVAPQAQILARIPDVKADGQWHSVNLDLIGYLERIYGSEEPIWLEDLYFANMHVDGYISAGFGGNHAGATLLLDNVYLGCAGPKNLTLAWSNNQEDAGVTEWSCLLDTQPYTLPDADHTVTAPGIAETLPGTGVYYAHVRPKLPDGSWGATVHRRILVDDDPPKVTGQSPKAGEASGAPQIVVGLTDPGGSGINPGSIRLRVQDHEYTCDGSTLRYDISQERLYFDLGAAGISLKDGQQVSVELASVSDRLGHALAAPVDWQWKYQFARDKTPPTTPYITCADDYLCRDDFERDVSQWATFGGPDGALVCRDPTTAAGGKYSLRLYNLRQGGRFGAYVRKEPFDAGKYRLMSFDYRVAGRLRADFGLYVNGRWWSVRFTDTDVSRSQMGQIPDVQTDGQWHHAEVNLFDLLRKSDPYMSNYVVRYLILADWGWMGNAQGRTYHIDNFSLIPVSNAADGLELSWKTTDASGIAGASYVLDRSPNTDPGKKKMTSGTSVVLRPDIDGECYFHVRAVDGAGNWSEPGHLRLIIDKDKPTVALVKPTPNERTATSSIIFDVTDKGPAGINPASLVVRIDGQEYNTASGYLVYHADEGRLIWDGSAGSRPITFADGQTVTVELTSAADFVGNQAVLPPAFTWTMDYSKDDEPPRVTQIRSTSHLTLAADTFEEGMGAWRSWGEDGGVAVALDETDAASGRRCLKVINEKAGGPMAVGAWAEEFSVDRYPILSFDYKLDPGVHLDLMVLTETGWQAIGFTDKDGQLLEVIPGAVADGRWHHATIDLAAMLRRQQRGGPLSVQQVVFSDRGNMDNAVGAVARFDNFIIGRIGKSSPSFRWKATDATGITDYSYALDNDPTTLPDDIGEGTGTAATFRGTQAGVWYFHVRAKDGAGNWGPAAHYAILHLVGPPSG